MGSETEKKVEPKDSCVKPARPNQWARSQTTQLFFEEEEAVLGEGFKNIAKEMSPTGQSKLIYGEKGADS